MVNAIGARKYSVIGEGLKTGDGIDSGAGRPVPGA